MKNLTNRVAVVTGSGSGIGRAICMELALKGADIAAVDINTAALEDLCLEVEALGRKCSTHVVDVSVRPQMESLVDEVIQAHGSVHILVNNAGVSVNLAFQEQTIEDIEWITGINYWGVMYGCKLFLPHLLEADEAHIVNMSSSAGFTGMKYQTSYSATKFAVAGFSEALHIELANTNVGITCVHPGAVATNILESARMESGRREQMMKMFPYARSPEQAAIAIRKAIENKRFKLVVCADSHVLYSIKRVAPVGLLNLMRVANKD